MRLWAAMTRWTESHRLLVDAVRAGALSFFMLLTGATDRSVYGAAATLWTVLMPVPLAWARTKPVASAAGVYAMALGHILLNMPVLFPGDLAVLVSLYMVTVHGPVWAHRTAMALTLLGSFVALAAAFVGVGGNHGFVSFSYAEGLIDLITITVVLWLLALVVWTTGLIRRARRERIDGLVERAARLEAERDQQRQLATIAERNRIAREMHDIVAHSLSVIIAQADGGRYVAAADPAGAAKALDTIADTGRAALADMRRLLGVLRHGQTGGDATRPDADFTPQPTLGDLDTLIDQLRSSGMRVSLIRMGAQRQLPPGAASTVYRVCQESLTNVLKHAGPDPTVTVLVQWRPEALVVQVTDDGRGAAATSDGAGQGLLGMRERAAMFGGRVTAGPRPGGGFQVTMSLPLGPPPEAAQHRSGTIDPTGVPTARKGER